MKKLMLSMIFGLMSGSLYAACMGVYCQDEKGAVIQSGVNIQGLTLTQMTAAIPSYTGQIIYVSDAKRGYVCISSGTTQGGYVVLVETGAMATPTHCQ